MLDIQKYKLIIDYTYSVFVTDIEQRGTTVFICAGQLGWRRPCLPKVRVPKIEHLSFTS